MVAKSISHHLRNPGMIRFPCKYQQVIPWNQSGANGFRPSTAWTYLTPRLRHAFVTLCDMPLSSLATRKLRLGEWNLDFCWGSSYRHSLLFIRSPKFPLPPRRGAGHLWVSFCWVMFEEVSAEELSVGRGERASCKTYGSLSSRPHWGLGGTGGVGPTPTLQAGSMDSEDHLWEPLSAIHPLQNKTNPNQPPEAMNNSDL